MWLLFEFYLSTDIDNITAAAAPRVVGGTGGGLPLAAGNENNGSVGCAEQRTGRAV